MYKFPILALHQIIFLREKRAKLAAVAKRKLTEMMIHICDETPIPEEFDLCAERKYIISIIHIIIIMSFNEISLCISSHTISYLLVNLMEYLKK